MGTLKIVLLANAFKGIAAIRNANVPSCILFLFRHCVLLDFFSFSFSLLSFILIHTLYKQHLCVYVCMIVYFIPTIFSIFRCWWLLLLSFYSSIHNEIRFYFSSYSFLVLLASARLILCLLHFLSFCYTSALKLPARIEQSQMNEQQNNTKKMTYIHRFFNAIISSSQFITVVKYCVRATLMEGVIIIFCLILFVRFCFFIFNFLLVTMMRSVLYIPLILIY